MARFPVLPALCTTALLWALPAPAQTPDVSACHSRCSQDFNTCFGVPQPISPPVILKEIDTSGQVLTPAPHEFCGAQRQACDADCNADYPPSRVAPPK